MLDFLFTMLLVGFAVFMGMNVGYSQCMKRLLTRLLPTVDSLDVNDQCYGARSEILQEILAAADPDADDHPWYTAPFIAALKLVGIGRDV